MTDVALLFGSDLSVDATGDLATVDGTEEGVERILRRLLTNLKEYLWNPRYGAGLPQFIGDPINAARIQAVVRRQMFLEAIVSRSPSPAINVSARADNSVFLDIKYVDSSTAQVVTLSASVSPTGTLAGTDFAIGIGRIGIDYLG